MLCELCKPLTIACLRDNDYDHQPDLAALKTSAEAHCEFCELLWACLIRSCHRDAIDSHLQGRVHGKEGVTDTAIRIRGEIHDYKQHDPDNLVESLIWVYSGEDREMYMSSSKGTEVYGKLKVYALPGEKPLDYIG